MPVLDSVPLRGAVILFSGSEAGVKYLPRLTSGMLRSAPPWAARNAGLSGALCKWPCTPQALVAHSVGGCCARGRLACWPAEARCAAVTRRSARKGGGLERGLEVVDVVVEGWSARLQVPAWRLLPQPRGRALAVRDRGGRGRLQSHRCPERCAPSTCLHGWAPQAQCDAAAHTVSL